MIHDPGPTITALYVVWFDDELGFAAGNLRNVEVSGLPGFLRSPS